MRKVIASYKGKKYERDFDAGKTDSESEAIIAKLKVIDKRFKQSRTYKIETRG